VCTTMWTYIIDLMSIALTDGMDTYTQSTKHKLRIDSETHIFSPSLTLSFAMQLKLVSFTLFSLAILARASFSYVRGANPSFILNASLKHFFGMALGRRHPRHPRMGRGPR
jgi:hypothetical protein